VEPNGLARCLSLAMRLGADTAEVYVERKVTQTFRFDDSQVSEFRSDVDLGAGVRVFSGGRAGLASTSVLTWPALQRATEAAVAASGATHPSGSRVPLPTPAPAGQMQTPRGSGDLETSLDPDEVVQTLHAIDQGARAADARISSVSITHVSVSQDVWIVRSDAPPAGDRRSRARVTCRVTARGENRLATGFSGPGVGGAVDLYHRTSPELVGRSAAERAVAALDGQAPPRGQLPVVIGPAGGGLLLHEACGHGLEADGLVRGVSVFGVHLGTAIGAQPVTAIDDPSLPLGFGSYSVDDEGEGSSATTLIDQGRVVGALSSRAFRATVEGSNGRNGRRASYADPAIPRMSNTYIANGETPGADIVESVGRGVYVAALKGGDVNIANGNFAFAASASYLIEGGKLTSPLRGLTLLGNGVTALHGVAAVGNDLDFTQAMCGKSGQWVPVSYGSPTLLIEGLTISADHDD
jgi:TldD protein